MIPKFPLPAISITIFIEHKGKKPTKVSFLGGKFHASEFIKVNLLIKKGNYLHKDLITKKRCLLVFQHYSELLELK